MVACTKKEVVRVRTEAANLEYLNQVEKLPVYVADDSDGRVDMHHVALLHQKLLGLGAYCLDHRIRQ